MLQCRVYMYYICVCMQCRYICIYSYIVSGYLSQRGGCSSFYLHLKVVFPATYQPCLMEVLIGVKSLISVSGSWHNGRKGKEKPKHVMLVLQLC